MYAPMDFEKELIEIGVPKDIVSLIISTFGGEMIYIPKKTKPKIQRDAEIKEKFSGNNHRLLAKEFNLTTRQIRVIVDGKSKQATGES